jgi:hypothetical protein
MLGTVVMKALTRNGKVVLTAPSDPRGNVGLATEIGKQQEATAIKSEFNPLLRLLHNDRLKLARFTNNDAAIKATNPELLSYHADPHAHQTSDHDGVHSDRLIKEW